MRLAHTLETRLQQNQRIDPRQIQASEILAWTLSELEAAIDRELAENPALETKDGESLSVSSAQNAESSDAVATLRLVPGGEMGKTIETPTEETPRLYEGLPQSVSPLQVVSLSHPDDNELDPLERVASYFSLRDHLRGQVGQSHSEVRQDILRYLIECIDERGYLVIDMAEVGETFRATRSTVEAAVKSLQTMDPPGVGARDLRECLLLQAEFLEQAGEGHPLLTPLLERCWEDLSTRRLEKIASRLKTDMATVEEILEILQKAMSPYPGALFRPAGYRGNRALPAIRPDVIFHRTPVGFRIEMTREYDKMLTVAPLWKALSHEPARCEDDSTRRYVKDHVDRAQSFLNGLRRRGRTLGAIAQELIDCQQGYLETSNRAFLRPLTRQSIAEKLELDESVISRAVADKWAQLPSGEIVALDAFFGNAHAIRDALVQLIQGENPQKPYSDDEIADILTAQGYPLARRTVAKYRNQEKILPARLRKQRVKAA
jgi:RNA polymerase sigma-54 factor